MRNCIYTLFFSLSIKTEIYSPIVQLKTENSSVEEGNVVVLDCVVDSNPASRIVWYKNGAEIKVDDANFFLGTSQCRSSKNGYYFLLKNGKKTFSRMIICDSRLDKNNGTFTCKARNRLGVGIASSVLTILSKCKFPLFKLFDIVCLTGIYSRGISHCLVEGKGISYF